MGASGGGENGKVGGRGGGVDGRHERVGTSLLKSGPGLSDNNAAVPPARLRSRQAVGGKPAPGPERGHTVTLPWIIAGAAAGLIAGPRLRASVFSRRTGSGQLPRRACPACAHKIPPHRWRRPSLPPSSGWALAAPALPALLAPPLPLLAVSPRP